MSLFHKIASCWEKLQVFLCSHVGREYQCGCGHVAKRKTAVLIHGKEFFYTLPSKAPDSCPQCLANAAIRCAWCGNTILPGMPVTLYSPGPVRALFSSRELTEAQLRRRQEDYVPPEYAVEYREGDRLAYVGCLGWDCDDCGDRAGFWVMPGRVQPVLTTEEMLLSGDVKAIIVNDLSDPNNITIISDD